MLRCSSLTGECDFPVCGSWPLIIFLPRNVMRTPTRTDHPDQDVYIGRSETAMWIRVVSSWVCILLYGWSLLAPVVMPDRFGDL